MYRPSQNTAERIDDMAITIHDFARLFLAKMAIHSVFVNETFLKSALIPLDYRKRIKKLLYSALKWNKDFTMLIDLDEYFRDCSTWLQKLSVELLNVATELGKTFCVDLVSEHMSISFSQNELQSIFDDFDDSINSLMGRFVALILNPKKCKKVSTHTAPASTKKDNITPEVNKTSGEIIYGKEPTDEEKERVFLSLVDCSNTIGRFIQKGKNTVQKATYNDPVGVSYAFNLESFADGTYMITKRPKK